jgi:hypothetical protein
MTVDDIAFIVPVEGALHALYLRDGRIVTVGTHDGKVTNVTRLPKAEEIAEAEERPKRQQPGFVSVPGLTTGAGMIEPPDRAPGA